jgi:hypothetical protein
MSRLMGRPQFAVTVVVDIRNGEIVNSIWLAFATPLALDGPQIFV